MIKTFTNTKTGQVVTLDTGTGKVYQPPVQTTPSGSSTSTSQPQTKTGQQNNFISQEEADRMASKQMAGGGMVNIKSLLPGMTPEKIQQNQQTRQEQEGILNAIPGVMGAIGGMTGGGAGAMAGGVGAIPGGALGTGAGTGAGFALENSIRGIKGYQDKTPEQQLDEASTKTGQAMLFDMLLSGAGKLLSGIVGEVAKQSIKVSLPEAAKQAQKAFGKSVMGTGKELAQEIIDRQQVGTAAKLYRTAQAGMKKMDEKIIPQLDKAIPKEQVGETLTRLVHLAQNESSEISKGAVSSEIKKNAIEEGDKILSRAMEDVNKRGASALWDLRKGLDVVEKGKAASQVTEGAGKFRASLANKLRDFFDYIPKAPQLAKDIDEKEFFVRLLNATKAAGAKPSLYWRLGSGTIGGAIGYQQGGATGMLTGMALSQAPYYPAFGTALARGNKVLEPFIQNAVPAIGAGALTDFSNPEQQLPQ